MEAARQGANLILPDSRVKHKIFQKPCFEKRGSGQEPELRRCAQGDTNCTATTAKPDRQPRETNSPIVGSDVKSK